MVDSYSSSRRKSGICILSRKPGTGTTVQKGMDDCVKSLARLSWESWEAQRLRSNGNGCYKGRRKWPAPLTHMGTSPWRWETVSL